MFYATFENLNKHINSNIKEISGNNFEPTWMPAPGVICDDGFYMSVQGSAYSYSSPKETGSIFYKVEIGYPSAFEETIIGYAENPDSPTDTVYGYVPIELVIDIINKHGGYCPTTLI